MNLEAFFNISNDFKRLIAFTSGSKYFEKFKYKYRSPSPDSAASIPVPTKFSVQGGAFIDLSLTNDEEDKQNFILEAAEFFKSNLSDLTIIPRKAKLKHEQLDGVYFGK